MSYTLCSIHILFIYNEFHKFWMSFDFRDRCTKIEQDWAKSQAERPLLGRLAWHLQEHGPGFDPVVMRHTHEALSRGLGSSSIGYTERLQHPSKDLQDSPRSNILQQLTSLEKAQEQSRVSAKLEAQMTQREAGRPPLGRPAWHMQLPTDSRRGSEPLSERRWTHGGIPRPAGLGEAGRPHMEAPQARVWHGS